MPESYTVQLTFRSPDEGGPTGRPLLKGLADEVVAWGPGRAGPPEGAFPYHGEWVTDSVGTYRVDGEADGSLEWWEFEWVQPDPARGALWVSQVQLATQGGVVESRIRVSGRAQPGQITPKSISVKRPNLVPILVSRFHATYFGERVEALPLRTITAPRVREFVTNSLENPKRRLPIVLISASESGEWLVSPEDAADTLAGLAEVAGLSDDSTSWELSSAIGSQLSCYRGAVRLYWPGFAHQTSNPYEQRLWLGWRIQDQGPRSVIDHLFNILCSRVARATGDMTLWKDVRDGISARRETQTRKRLQELGANSELVSLAEQEIKDARVARERAAKFEKDLQEAEKTIGKLEEELEAQREQWSQYQAYAGSRSDETPESPQITSVLDAVELARDLANTNILATAIDSARKSLSNRGPDLYKVFCALDQLVIQYQSGLGGVGVKKWLGEQLPYVAFEYKADISDITEGKYGEDYTFGGTLMGKHLSFGGGHNSQNHVSVHFEFDFSENPPRCVIGWAGKHRRNTMS